MRCRPVLPLLACLLLSLAAGVLVGRPAPSSAATAGDFSTVGHRGSPSRYVTENTGAAQHQAWRANASAVEVDINLTGDHQMIVMHDPTLDRTTTCRGRLDRLTFATIRSRCRGRAGREVLPSLPEVLNWVQRNRMNLVLEVKPDPQNRWTTDDFALIDRLLRARGLLRRTIILSFRGSLLVMAERVDPALRTQWIANRWEQVPAAIPNVDGFNIYARDLNPQRVAALHRHGKLVLGRRTNNPADWQRLRWARADGVITDQVSTHRRWLRSR